MSLSRRILHPLIIVLLAVQALYCLLQLVVVLQPPGTVGPLFGAALTIDPDLLVARRLYAIEMWVTLVGLALYLGITEIAPSRRTGSG